MATEAEKLRDGAPVFKETLTNKGWVLNIFKNNEIMMTTSLYDDGGSFIETKAFNTQIDNDVEIFRKYVEYFKEDAGKNVKKMTRMSVRAN